jgi:hypothetical protein
MNALPASFARRPVVQVGYLVPDIESAVRKWVERVGAGPFYIYEHFKPALILHRGKPAQWDHSAAFGQWGSVQLELIKVHSMSPATLSEQFSATAHRLHHLTWFSDDVAQESARLAALGWPEVMRMRMNTGTPSAFNDARADLGHLIELYPRANLVAAHYDAIARAAVGWDGTRPLRSWDQRPVEGIDLTGVY